MRRTLEIMEKYSPQEPFLILSYEGKKNKWVEDIERKMNVLGLKRDIHYTLAPMPWIDVLETTIQKDYERINLISSGKSSIFTLQNWGVDGYNNIIEFLFLSQRRIKSHLRGDENAI